MIMIDYDYDYYFMVCVIFVVTYVTTESLSSRMAHLKACTSWKNC